MDEKKMVQGRKERPNERRKERTKDEEAQEFVEHVLIDASVGMKE